MARAISPSPHQEMAGQVSERREPDATRPTLAILGRQGQPLARRRGRWRRRSYCAMAGAGMTGCD